ncbi:MAG: UvrB/UvrC motif-containing protein [Flavobacteriales bacterium]|nr:UvrB/UvrC motif-containing protein [Flavobacteriales bacterium]
MTADDLRRKKVNRLSVRICKKRRFLWISLDNEEYEQAAKLRDELKSLQTEMTSLLKS